MNARSRCQPDAVPTRRPVMNCLRRVAPPPGRQQTGPGRTPASCTWNRILYITIVYVTQRSNRFHVSKHLKWGIGGSWLPRIALVTGLLGLCQKTFETVLPKTSMSIRAPVFDDWEESRLESPAAALTGSSREASRSTIRRARHGKKPNTWAFRRCRGHER